MRHFNKFLVIATSLLAFTTFGQTKDYPWLFGIGTHGPDYTINDPGFWKQLGQPKDYNLAWTSGQIRAARQLHPWFTLGVSFSGGEASKRPRVLEPWFPTTTEKKLFLDLDAHAQIKFLANGTVLRENHWFDPYILLGGGLNRFDKTFHGTLDAGLGVNFWFTKQFGLNIQTAYNWIPKMKDMTKNGSFQHHSAGLVFRFGKGKDSDGDGVTDANDACPTVVGVIALKGCPDADGDGITDASDACPTVAGIIAFNGCPDTDGDGIADKDDACPTVAGSATFKGCPDTDGDGIADNVDDCPTVYGTVKGCPDTDGDGIVDSKDACPTVKGSAALRGCPDRDGDGITDADDNCPDVAGVAANKGCPAISAEKKTEIQQKIAYSARKIQFETNSDVIKTVSYTQLNDIVNYASQYDFLKFSIEGHTDSDGDDARNLDLSSRRAAAVMQYLINKGVTPSRLRASGYGESRPIADNKTAAGKAQNRRVEVNIID